MALGFFRRLFQRKSRLLGNSKSRPILQRTRLGLEALEDRVMPSITPSLLFSPLSSQVSSLGNSSSGLTSILKQGNTVLPIINQKLSDLVGQAGNANTDLTNQLANPGNLAALQNDLNSLDPKAKEQLATDIATALPGLAQHVQVLTLDPVGGNVEIMMDLVKPVTTQVPFNFGTGLPGLPFRISSTGGAELTATFEYDHLDFGLSAGQFFLKTGQGTDQSSQLKFTLKADLQAGSQLSGQFGLLYVTATPNYDATAAPNNHGVALSGSVVADVIGSGVQGTTVDLGLGTPRLDAFTANADLHLEAHMTSLGADRTLGDSNNVQAVDSTELDLSLPHIQADFHLFWDLSGSDPGAGLADLGSQPPTVQLNNVTVNLGSFLGSAMAPLVDMIQQVTAPIQPALDVLNAPIPGLSDLGVGPVSLMSLAGALNQAGLVPQEYQPIVSLAKDIDDLLTAINTLKIDPNTYDIGINTGSFDLSHQTNTSDLRTLAQAGTLDQLAVNPADPDTLKLLATTTQKLGALVNSQLSDSDPIQSEVKSKIQDMLKSLDTLNNGIDVSFPLIENPSLGAVQLLLGRDTDLVSFQANFNIHTGDRTLADLPVWGPIHFALNGSLDLNMHFEAAYDSYGFREFLANGGLYPSNLADGFSIDARQPLIDFQASVTASLEGDEPPPVEMVPNPAYVSWVPPSLLNPPTIPAFVKAHLDAALSGHFTLQLNDPTGGQEIRPFQDELDGQLFDAQGDLSADLS